MFAENGPLETAQVIACVIAFIGFFWGAVSQWREGLFDRAAVLILIGLIAYVGAGREVSFGAVFGVEGAARAMIETVLGAFLAVMLLIALALFVISVKRCEVRWGRAAQGASLFALALLTLVLAQGFDGGDLGLPPSQIWEEVLELVGYVVLILHAGLRLARPLR